MIGTIACVLSTIALMQTPPPVAAADSSGVHGLWKLLPSEITFRLESDGDRVHGEMIHANGNSGGTIELAKQADGTYEGKIHESWLCVYTGGFNRRQIAKDCQLEQQIKFTRLEPSRIAGEILRTEAPKDPRKYAKYCKTCTASESATWHDFVLERKD